MSVLSRVSFWPQDETANRTFKYNGLGYAFFSKGVCLHGWTNVGVGGGAERFLWRGLTIGLDAGYYKFPAEGNAGYGVLMLGPGYHFVNRKKPVKFDPFVNGNVLGIPINRVGLARAGSLGGGVNCWLKERMGLQIGGQAQVVNRELLLLFRIGLTFR